MSQINPKPSGYQTITPSIVVPNSVHAIALYAKAFGAKQIELIRHGDRVVHAEVKIGDSILMLADENKEWNLISPGSLGGTASSLYLYVDNVDDWFERAVAKGCDVEMPPENMFWGDRFAQVRDPFGHVWSLASHVEDVSHEEIQRRMDNM